MHSGDCRVIIASPTLAQGLNLSASVLLVPSIWRGKQVIPAEEFANVAGRAGRAFVDVEGLILHVVWSGAPYEVKWRVDQWWGLVRRAGAPIVRSGLLMLAMQIYERMATAHGVPMAEVMDYVTGNARAWDLGEAQLSGLGVPQEEWERELASLDAAVLVLVDAATEAGDLRNAVGRVLEGSLFVRQAEDDAAASVLVARAVHIWSRTERVHRQGFHAAGVGLKAGLFLDKNRAWLLERLREAEGALEAGDEGGAAREIVGFAARVFEVAPFRPRVLPKGWQSALEQWVSGSAWALVVKVCGEKASEDLQDGFVYRLPWAMEASRVHALAVGDEGAESIVGLAAVAAEVGSANRSEMILLRSGLESRAAARAAVYSTGAEFVFGYRVRD